MESKKKSSSDSTPPPAGEREMVITRLIDAPRERVWQAWADADQVAAWWGPYGFTTRANQREFKPGGVWRHTMVGPDGVEYPNLSRFEEIVEPERIVYSHGGGRKDGQGASFRTTVTFVARGDKTELTMRAVFETREMLDHVVKEYKAIEGGRQTLARLASHVAGEFVLSRLVGAPRARVWQAWTRVEELGTWFGPKGFDIIAAKLDLREGGTYHYGLRGPNRLEVWGLWTFREIVAPERITLVQAFSNPEGGPGKHPLNPNWPPKMLSTFDFTDLGDRTLITVIMGPYEATDLERKTFEEGKDSMRMGWTGTFERLDDHLAGK